MTIRINARKLLEVHPDVLWEQLTDYYDVVFDDKVIRMHGSEITLSRYAWCFHQTLTSLPLLSTMTVLPYLKLGVFTTSTMRQLFNVVLWQAYDLCSSTKSPYDLVSDIQWANMHLYNAASRYTARHISSLHTKDYFELRNHPKLVALKEKAAAQEYSMRSVEEAIKAATKLMTNGELTDERGRMLTIPMSCVAGVIKAPQAVQAVFMRGTVPDINMVAIPYPLTNSLADGMNTPLDYAILSREGAISEMASMDDLQRVCYGGRKLALIAQSKQTIVPVDCGSENYVWWTIIDPRKPDDVNMAGSELDQVVGMWYKTEDGSLRQIQATDTHLYGQTIQRRSPLTCKLLNGHEVCQVCFGQLHEVLSDGGNIGVTVSKQFTQGKAQSALSLKHLLASLTGEVAQLDAQARKFLKVHNNMYQLTPNVLTGADNVYIEVDKNSVFNLTTLATTLDVFSRVPSSFSSFSSIKLHVCKGGKTTSAELILSKNRVMCMFSYDLLDMIKQGDIVKYNDTSCIVDITDIGTKTLFIKPEALPPISELSNHLSKIFERGGSSDNEDIRDLEDLGGRDIMGTLGRLQVILKKLGPAHLSIVEILLAAYLTTDDEYNVHNATEGLSKLVHPVLMKLMLGRSLSTWMIFNSPVTAFFKLPGTFNIKNRDDSVLDAFIDPVGVLAAQ